ncbi:hypothetical protein ABFO59_05140 [Acinetobacter radioresistens]|uniref:hypothetical protein n=1 Tax=Acinetobacter radioresistens TaxID=40216 RepID=UPI0032159AB1
MPKSTPENKTYDAGDMYTAYSLAECDMQWMFNAISDLTEQIERLRAMAESGELDSKYYFDPIITRSNMYEYLAEDRMHHHQREAEVYKNEWEAFKRSNQS